MPGFFNPVLILQPMHAYQTEAMIYLHARGLYHVLLPICNRELLFIGKRKDEDDMAKSTKTYEERIRALEKKEQESIEATKKLIACLLYTSRCV